MTATLRQWGLLGVVTGGVLLVDQISKRLIVSNLALYESVQPLPALYPYFQITRSFNTGAAFGFLANTGFSGVLFLGVALVVTVALLWNYVQLPPGALWSRFAIALVIGGALGNAIDRVLYGHVVDFIHYQIPNLISNVSNLADHAIVLGVVLMIITSWQMDAPQPATDP